MAVRTAGVAFATVLFAAVAAAGGRNTAAAQSFPVASGVRLGGDETDTRFVMDLSRKIDLHAFTLANPYRVVVDIPEVVFRLPPKAGETGHGLVKAYRFGLMMTGASRIVLDMASPVRIAKAFVVDPAQGQPARLVLALVPTDRAGFLHTVALEDKALVRQPPVQAAPRAKSGDGRPLIVLDPGHGGIDSGSRAASGEQEKTIVLDFARRLRKRLDKSGKYRILMTRSDDTFVPLDERVRMARKAGAALFLSIHADSLPHREGDARGATVYTLSNQASDAQAAQLAAQENHSDVIAGVNLNKEPNDVAGILIDLAQRETNTFSVQFARDVASGFKGVTPLHKDPVKAAGFRVLRAPDVPSALVELGYLSDPSDLKLLDNPSWRDRTAKALAKSIDAYFASHLVADRAGAD